MEERKCLNCSYNLVKIDKFCAQCGQKYSVKEGTVKSFFVDFLGDYFTFDSKIFRSLQPLLFKPGFLTTEYLNGRRVSYIPPLRLYIFISIIFFLIFKFTNPFTGSELNDDNEMSQDLMDYFVDHHWHKVFFALLPLFAVIVYLFYRKIYKNYLSHFIFSLHFHSFLFILLSIYMLITAYVVTNFYSLNFWLLIVFLFGAYFYLFVALKNVFQETNSRTVLKLLGIGILYMVLFLLTSITALTIYYSFKS